MDYGYVRVSSVSQNPDRQIREMLKRGIKKTNIYVSASSSAKTTFKVFFILTPPTLTVW